MTPQHPRAPHAAELPGAAWRKSSYSGGTGNCVELAGLGSGVTAVRDSKRPAQSPLLVEGASWSAFARGVRTGRIG